MAHFLKKIENYNCLTQPMLVNQLAKVGFKITLSIKFVSLSIN